MGREPLDGSARLDPLPALTGLRFLAAFCVLIGHCVETLVAFSDAEPLWRDYLAALSGIGMPLFFVLSGFVIHYNYHHSLADAPVRGTFNFFVARFARLYPLYIVVLALDLFRHGYFENLSDPEIWRTLRVTLPSYLGLVQSWHYQIVGPHSLVFILPAMTQVTWSISTEWFFYLFYPFASLALARLRRPRGIFAAVAGVVAVGYAGADWAAAHFDAIDAYGVAHFGPLARFGQTDEFPFWLFYLSPYPRLLEFVLGCLAAALFTALRDRPVSRPEGWAGRCGLVLAIGGIIGTFAVLYHPQTSSVLARVLGMCFGFAPFVALLLFCCTRYASWISAALSRPRIVLCGEISYSIYLLHIGVVQYVQISDQNAGIRPPAYTIWNVLHAGVTVAVVTVIVIGASLITYTLVEVPARHRLRRWLSLPSRRPAAPAHAVVEPRPAND